MEPQDCITVAEEHLRWLFGSLDQDEQIYLAPADAPKFEVRVSTLEEAFARVRGWQTRGVFVSTGTFRQNTTRERKHLLSVSAVLLDADLKDKLIAEGGVDREEAERQVRAYPEATLQKEAAKHRQVLLDVLAQAGLRPSCLIFTGGGHQVSLLLDLSQQGEIDRIVRIHKAIVLKLNGLAGWELCDRQVVDAGTRYARLPGTANVKSDPPRWAVTVQNSGPTYTLEQLEEIVGLRPEQAEPETEAGSGGDVEKVVSIMLPYWKKGERHELALSLAGFLAKAEWRWETVNACLTAIATQTNDEELRGRLKDLETTFARLAKGENVKGYTALAKVLTAEDMSRLETVAGSIEIPLQNSKENSLSATIGSIILAKKLPDFIKKRRVAKIIQQHLSKRGAFYRTPDSRFFFFSHEERQLYDLEQQPFSYLLIEESGLSSTETYFKFALDTLTAHVARQGERVVVHTLAHYNAQTRVLTVSDGGGGVWRREPGGQWARGKNGDEGILFLTEPEATPWTPDFNSHGALHWLLDQINFQCKGPLSVEDQRAFFSLWLLHQFFPSLRRTRTVPAWLGPQGSGKSTTCRLVGRFLIGETFEVVGLRKDKEDAFVAAITNRVVHAIDNADTRVDWLEDALARYATGEVFRLRRLYTTNEEASYRARAVLMLTSRDPHFQRPDVAQRLLPFHLQEIEDFQDEPTIFSELARRRNALWGDLLSELATVQDALCDTPRPKLPFRMADFGAFGWQVFYAQGREQAWVAALQRLDAAQMEFAAKGDGMVTALGILMKGQSQIGPLSVGDLYTKVAAMAAANTLTIPKTAEWFGRKLTALHRVIEAELHVTLLDEYGHQSKRWITLKTKKDYGNASPASPEAGRAGK